MDEQPAPEIHDAGAAFLTEVQADDLDEQVRVAINNARASHNGTPKPSRIVDALEALWNQNKTFTARLKALEPQNPDTSYRLSGGE